MIKDFLTKKITRTKLDEFISLHKSDLLTLDIGCSGSPNYTKYFKNRIGLDVKAGGGVDIVGDAHNLPFEDGKFDIVLCTEVLEHLHSPQIAIAEMKRVLKIGGKLILTTRFIFPIHDAPGDYYRFTKYGLMHLFKDWEIVELKEEVNTKDTLVILLQRIGYQSELRVNFLFKFLLFLAAKILYILPNIIRTQYGDIGRKTKENNILSSGYYLICYKNRLVDKK